MGKRQWITDAEASTPSYIINRSREGDLVDWLHGDVAVVADLYGDAAYARNIGEDHDTYGVWVLTDVGPVPCRVTEKACPGTNLVQVTVHWRKPGVRGNAGKASESAFRMAFDF